MGFKKIVVLDISDYPKDPDVYLKRPYEPGFGPRSTTWVIWYFYYTTVRKKTRVYESYGRTAEEAKMGLIKAKVKYGPRLINCSKEKFLQLKKQTKKKK